jgi:hypothetical protein
MELFGPTLALSMDKAHYTKFMGAKIAYVRALYSDGKLFTFRICYLRSQLLIDVEQKMGYIVFIINISRSLRIRNKYGSLTRNKFLTKSVTTWK